MDDIKLRSEIDDKYKWDLSKLENILNDNAFEKINNLTDKLLELKGKITLNSDNLFNAI